MPYIPHTDEDLKSMLELINVNSIEELFADIKPEMRPKTFDLPKAMTELEVDSYFNELSAKNKPVSCFLGAGYYNHYIPKAVDALSGRGEFLTSYTPYQPEVSQGTLQSVFEYQTAMARLLEMDYCNASVFEAGDALFEAGMMASRHTKKSTWIVDEAINPVWRKMLDTYSAQLDINIITVAQNNGKSDKEALKLAVEKSSDNGECAAVMVQNPNFFGAIDDYSDVFAVAKAKKVINIMAVYPMMQAILKTPGEMGADIAIAEGQSLGLPLSFGGAYLGILTCAKFIVRQIPGRIVGQTQDVDGKIGYVLTLQAREQHIRRAKATSNICSNQGLCALRSIIFTALLGTEGLVRIAEHGMINARALLEKLSNINGVSLLNDAPFGNEFAIKLPKNASEVVEELLKKGIAAGLPLGQYYNGMDNVLLIACTEKTTMAQIDELASCLGGLI